MTPKALSRENRVQKAVKQRDEIIKLLGYSFLEFVENEDNSWRVKHNLIMLELQFEKRLLDYLLTE